MFASIRRAWMRAFYPQPAPAPEPIRFKRIGHQGAPMLRIVITGAPGSGKSLLAREIWAALEERDRARTYIETGYHEAASEKAFIGADIAYRQERRAGRPKLVPYLREGTQ